MPENAKPNKPAKDASEVGAIIWKKDFADFKRRERIWAQANPRTFNMVLGKCTQAMKAKLEGRKVFAKILEEEDGVRLLTAYIAYATSRTADPPAWWR